jgi:hypothetical protein
LAAPWLSVRYNGLVKLLWLWPLLLAACSFDGAGLGGSARSDAFVALRDVAITDVRDELSVGGDASLDSGAGSLDGARHDGPGPDAPSPDALALDLSLLDSGLCAPNPCQNGGTCQVVNGSAACQCAPGFNGPTCGVCALGHSGASCTACPSTKLAITSCSHPSITCDKWIDGDNSSQTSDKCPSSQLGCFASDVDLDLGARRFVDRLRFLSDWWAKRPGTWELWASDNNKQFSLVVQGRSNKAPWKCVHGDPCGPEVPSECCPGGSQQDTTTVGAMYPKWDDVGFTGVVARYWRFRIKATDDTKSLIMRELELFGHSCLGAVTCATSSCGKGVCTGQQNGNCSCAGCITPATCTSAFNGAAPACTTP